MTQRLERLDRLHQPVDADRIPRSARNQEWMGWTLPASYFQQGGIELRDCTWSHVALTECAHLNATGSTLQHCSWIESSVSFARWTDSLWTSVDLRNAKWIRCVLDRVHIQACDWSYSTWDHCIVRECSSWVEETLLSHARFTSCVFVGIDFTESNLDTWDTVVFENCTFISCRVPEALRSLLATRGHLFLESVQETEPALPVAPVAATQAPTTKSLTTPAMPPLPKDRFGALEPVHRSDLSGSVV